MEGVFLSLKTNSQKEEVLDMKEKLEQLLAEGKARIEAVRSETELQDIKAALVGKQGSLTELMT